MVGMAKKTLGDSKLVVKAPLKLSSERVAGNASYRWLRASFMEDQSSLLNPKNPNKLSVFGLLFWAIAIILSFLMLPLVWALFTLIFVSILLPILDIIILGILTKLLIRSGHKNLSKVIIGAFEAIITITIGIFIVSPSNFVHVALLVNAINQYTRYQKDKNIGELFQFYTLIFFWLVFIVSNQLIK